MFYLSPHTSAQEIELQFRTYLSTLSERSVWMVFKVGQNRDRLHTGAIFNHVFPMDENELGCNGFLMTFKSKKAWLTTIMTESSSITNFELSRTKKADFPIEYTLLQTTTY